jgi:hypothetical protein
MAFKKDGSTKTASTSYFVAVLRPKKKKRSGKNILSGFMA